jgi:hypothetical protein
MLDWLASVAVVRKSERRIELAVTAATRWAGWALTTAATALAAWGWMIAPLLAAFPAVIALVGFLLATTRRRLVFDLDDGLLRVEQRVLGMRSRLAVPLFHLRAVVVAAEEHHFVAYLERRLGGRIRIDDSRHLAPLVALARQICEVAQLRLIIHDGAHPNSSAG